PSPVPCTVMWAVPVASAIFGSAFLPQEPRSRSCADWRVAWYGISFSSEVPNEPLKQVVLEAQLRSVETNPSPRTTMLLGSITFVEPLGWRTRTPGASSSAIWTSSGGSRGDSPCEPAMYV